MNMEVEAFIFGKKIGTILLKDGIVYFDRERDLQLRKNIAQERNRLIQKMTACRLKRK